MTSSSAERQAAAREAIISMKHAIDRLSEITPETIDQLEEQVGEACVTVKSWHYEGGRDYGHLAVILPEDDYRDIIANPGWTYTVPPANPSEYPPAAVTAPAARRGQIEAEWTRLEHNHLDQAGV